MERIRKLNVSRNPWSILLAEVTGLPTRSSVVFKSPHDYSMKGVSVTVTLMVGESGSAHTDQEDPEQSTDRSKDTAH